MRQLRTWLALERNMLVLAGTVILMLSWMYTWYQLLPVHLRDLGASDEQVGLSYSLINLGYSLMQFLGGLLADRYGRKWLIVLPTLGFVPLYLLAGACTHWLPLLLVMLLTSSLSALQWPSFLSLIAESVKDEQRGAAFGVFEFCVGLGVTAGPALGAILIPTIGRRMMIAATGLVALLCTVLRLGLKETAHRQITTEDGPGDSEARLAPTRLRWFLAAACLFYVAMGLTVHGPFITLHAADVMHFTDQQINSLFAVGGFWATISSLIGGKVIQRVGSTRALIVSVLGHTATLVSWALATGALTGLPIFTVSWMLMQMGFIAYETMLSDVTTPRTRGTMMGLFGTVTGLVSASAPTLGAWLLKYMGFIAPFWTAFLFAVLTAVLLARVTARPGGKG
ncbi:MAG: MFS transporter [Anaerolineae bacterium]|nr:MFS transporter [Anaerolineae bacterium]MDH7474009.1 MFS transporter [Anaerolineae bacterium]